MICGQEGTVVSLEMGEAHDPEDRYFVVLLRQPLTRVGLIDGGLGKMNPEAIQSENKNRHSASSVKSSAAMEGGIGITLGKFKSGMNNADRIYVLRVNPSGPAGRSERINANDLVHKIDGQTVDGLDLENVSSLLEGKPGSKVTLDMYKGGSKKDSDVSSGRTYTINLIREVPIGVPRSSTLDAGIGMTIGKFEKGMPNADKIYVIHVYPGGPAGQSGKIRAGDLLYQIDGKNVEGWDLTEVFGLIGGEVGTKVSLWMGAPTYMGQESGYQTFTVDLVRALPPYE